MIRDPNEIIQRFFSNMQKFLEEQSRQASAMMPQGPAEQLSQPSAMPSQDTAQRTVQGPGEEIDSQAQGEIIDLLNHMVEKIEELGSRIQKVEKRLGIKVELQKKEPVDQAGLPGAASPEHH